MSDNETVSEYTSNSSDESSACSEDEPLSSDDNTDKVTVKVVTSAPTEELKDNLENFKEPDGIYVATTHNNKITRKWDKVQFCVFCGEPKQKIARHLMEKHKEEIDLIELESLCIKDTDNVEVKKCKLNERKRKFEKLRKRGNFNHNMDVLRYKKGFLVVEKRPPEDTDYRMFLPYEYCLGFYHKKLLRRHIKFCHWKPVNCTVSKRIQSSASMLCYSDPVASHSLNNIIKKMLVDDVSLCLRNDQLIIKYGNTLCKKLLKAGDQQHHISNKLRELGRLVLEARKCCSHIVTLKDCLQPQYFDFIVEAATELCGKYLYFGFI